MNLACLDDALMPEIRAGQPVLWTNPDYRPAPDAEAQAGLESAVESWRELAPLLGALWPELPQGRIGSGLTDLAPIRDSLGYGSAEFGTVLLKEDHALPVAGSVKARGGVFEVLSTAVAQARAAGLLPANGDVALLAGEAARGFFAQRRIIVGSTGNLGLSVGIAARALGYRAVVHMSVDAKPWKVARLRDLGVEVVQHESDYSAAVAAARKIAAADPLAHFVDDEDSLLLFRGYSAAAAELNAQLEAMGLPIGADRPLFLYLPCGIGGAPGGIAYGARGIFGAHVHPFFVEPAQAPSAMVQMMTGAQTPVSVYDIGLTNKTAADGMAVATMSELVAKAMRRRLAGVFTVGDDDLFRWVHLASRAGLRLEPSAAAGFGGPRALLRSETGARFCRQHGITAQAVHVIWATGGNFVPQDQYESFVQRGAALPPEFDQERLLS